MIPVGFARSLARGLAVCLGLALTAALTMQPGSLHAAQSDDADTLARRADATVRTAERDMFNGKKEQADQELEEASALIGQLKAADPAHRKLKSIESMYARVRRDLDRRMQKRTPSPAASSARPAQPSTGPAAAHSSSSSEERRQQAMADRAVKKAVSDVDYALRKVDELMARDDSGLAMPDPPAKKIEKARRYLDEAEGYLSQVEGRYAGRLPSPNADFATAREKIAAAAKKVDAWGEALSAGAERAAAASSAAAGEARQSRERAAADAEKMAALYDAYYPKLESMNGNSLVYGMKVEDAQKALDQIEAAERLFPEFSSELGALADRYGHDAMAINNTLHGAGYKASGDPGGKLARLIEAVGKIGETRRSSAETVAMDAENLLGAFSNQLNDARLQRMRDAKALLVVGSQLDPDSRKIRGMLATIDDQITQAADRMESQIDAARWKGNVKGFPGPGDAADLARQALAYFRSDRDWGKKAGRKIEVLAVSVRGPWKVAERDVFGRVIRWRLPIHVAVTDDTLRPRNIARVYDLSIVARQGAPDKAPKAPPFDGYWVGDNWMMRLDKL